jgi:hypothetical protein
LKRQPHAVMLVVGGALITLGIQARSKERREPVREGEQLRRQAIRAEHGQTLILFVVAVPLLFALIALVSDGSNVFASKRSLQNAADASVLAAVRELNPCFGTGSSTACTGQVQATANDYSFNRNGGPAVDTTQCDSGTPPVTTNCYKTPYPTPSDFGGLQIRLSRSVPFGFGRVVGLSSGSVSAKASATLGVLAAAGNVAPIPIDKAKFCTKADGTPRVSWSPPSPPPDACFGLPDITVSFDTTDKKKPMLMDLDIVSTTGPVIGSTVNTTDMLNWITYGHPGTLPGKAWYGGNTNSGGHNGIQTAFKTDGTPTFIPLYVDRDTSNVPPNWYHVIGFAAFVITSLTWNGGGHELIGHWVKFVDSGVVANCTPSTPCSDFGVRGVALDG